MDPPVAVPAGDAARAAESTGAASCPSDGDRLGESSRFGRAAAVEAEQQPPVRQPAVFTQSTTPPPLRGRAVLALVWTMTS